jgi:predicted adenine nucleotide alpha hydrolase (AANH) superfamily ATPase
MHCCCAPCAVKCAEELKKEGEDFSLFWYNPNIHPLLEYRARHEQFKEFCAKEGYQYFEKDEYGLREFVKGVAADIENRCAFCYKTRLEETAKFAKVHDFRAFTTTLLISPYQKRDLLIETGNNIAKEYGLIFLEKDFRPLFRQGQTAARERGYYMQKYCGCVFSEEVRYSQKNPITK